MNAQKITDLTIDDLTKLIEETVDRRIDDIRHLRVYPKPKDDRTLEEVLESIKRNRWTPPPGAKSSLELLREDRDA